MTAPVPREQRWARPAGGREPAAAALLGWLADPHAPRLCVVTGSAGCGKSTLLAWLVGHGTRPGTGTERRVHGFVPAAGLGVRAMAWMLADQLGVAARTPGELARALAADGRRTLVVLPELHAAADLAATAAFVDLLTGVRRLRLLIEVRTGEPALPAAADRAAVLDLDDPRWTDESRRASWAEEHAASDEEPREDARSAPERAGSEEPLPDLDDPVAVLGAEPYRVTTAYETAADAHGGLREAWLRAGQALVAGQPPAGRALALRAALGDGADPRLAPALDRAAADAPWRLVWSRVRGDVRPPWPGPALALTLTGGRLLSCDHQGTVRLLDPGTAAAQGRLSAPYPGVTSVAGLPDGAVLVLDAHGRVHVDRDLVPRPTGLEALLAEDAGPAQEEAAKALRAACEVTALATSPSGLTAVGGGDGTVHLPAVSRSARLHEGPVTALTLCELPPDDVPLLYSGGADGQVRAWGPGGDPLAEPVVRRRQAVTALSAREVTGTGPVLAVAWSDGRVDHHVLDTGVLRSFRPGQPVTAVAVTPDGGMIVGTRETLVALRPV
ncbi:hypothetical protein ACWC10_22080 [Streptomyces sp. NPDC001595]|uniref:hypothetical protein n=1 Tax=Streptomyces sp. NPDC001532 TaxID=3154520 RepID=UPI003323E1AA